MGRRRRAFVDCFDGSEADCLRRLSRMRVTRPRRSSDACRGRHGEIDNEKKKRVGGVARGKKLESRSERETVVISTTRKELQLAVCSPYDR